MYSYADRIRAVKLYIQYGKRAMAVVRELGYPSRKNLRRWYDAYVEADDLPGGYRGVSAPGGGRSVRGPTEPPGGRP